MTFTLRESDWNQTPTNLQKWQEKQTKKALKSIVGIARMGWSSWMCQALGIQIEIWDIVIFTESAYFSVGEGICPKAEVGDNIKVTYPHCVSVFKFVIAKLKEERIA